MLRMPDGMRHAIAERAKTNGRSMNSEIVQIIEDAINSDAIKKRDEELNQLSFKISYLETDIFQSERYGKNVDEKKMALSALHARRDELKRAQSDTPKRESFEDQLQRIEYKIDVLMSSKTNKKPA